MSKVLQGRLPCPSCTSSDAYHLYDDGHGYCFSCSYYKPREGETSTKFTYEYLPWRGVDKWVMEFYDVKTKLDPDGRPVALGYKYSNGSYKIRSLLDKDFRSEGDIAKAGLFGMDRFSGGSHQSITITEGELDALSLYSVLRSPCVSVQSSVTAARDCVVARSYLSSFDRVYLAFDNDSAGHEATRQVARLFDYNKVFHVKFTKRKDANDYVQAGETEELRNVWWNSRRYLPENIISSLSDFEEILAKKETQAVPYPFPELTELTYGIRTGETVLITAPEGIGKTEFMHAIEHKLLKETEDAVGAIFLEEPKQRHLQALAGIELAKPVHLPDVLCAPGEIYSALTKVVKQDERLYVYSHFGSDDPELLIDTVRFLVSGCNCKYILLDHITMAVSGLAGEDERRALDYLSTRLEMMVKELDFALIIVSHVNDLGQTRGSRYISKIADIRIDLSRDVMADDPIQRNTTDMVVAKNRFSGRTGSAGSVLFDLNTFTYQPQGVF